MPIKVIHAGTGFTGLSALKAILRDPALELVGWLVNTPEKEGLDAGEFCGMAANGIIATRSIDDVVALDADVLNYSASIIGREGEAVDHVVRFLERGIDVTTFVFIAMIYPPAAPPEMRAKIEAACKKGGSSFYATGSEPGILSMSLPATLLSGAGSLDHYGEQMFVLNMMDTYPVPEVLRESMGFGQPMGTTPNRYRDGTAMAWWKPSIHAIANLLGVAVDDFEFSLDTCPTHCRIETGMGPFEENTIGGYYWQLRGMVGGKPLITVEYVAYLTPDIPRPADWPTCAPDTREAALVYVIDGDPAFRTQLYLDTDAGKPNASIPMTALHALNAIPAVCSARPGVLHALQLPHYATRDISAGGG